MPSGTAPTLLPFGRLAPGALSGSSTRARQATGTHLHRIDGYSLVEGTVAAGTAIRSSRFHVGGHHWELLYYPNGVNHLHRGFVSVDLALAGSAGTTGGATASYRVTILDYAGNPVHSRILGPLAFDRHGGGSRWTGIEELVATEELVKTAPFLIKDDRLNVRCDVAVLVMETKPRNRWFMQLDRAINGFR
jgi:speckle-type POZ protein